MARTTREIRIGNVKIGGANPVAVQSMAATRTQDIAATIRQVELLEAAGADVIRIAVDNPKDVAALKEIRDARPNANLSIDLQENYRLAEKVAPYVQKLRYNPGHLYHLEREKPVREKVQYLVDVARAHDCAMRIGVNCGSVDPEKLSKYPKDDSITPMLESALEHCAMLDDIGFDQYCVSLKDSDPNKVIDANVRFAEARPDVPLHLGVTEAGMPPDGIIKTRIAFEQLLTRGIGDTIRVSLTLPFERKGDEITVGRQLLDDIAAGRFRSVPRFEHKGLNIISCPSCSRVENDAFVDLAHNVREMTAYAKEYDITIAVMGCRVNGPGETDDADLGMWCAPSYVNLKRGEQSLGQFTYDEILGRVRVELDRLIEEKKAAGALV
ncbi:MAG TPA: (E)-4-hydroxy-3-methylbut-2-enyl-diphosphate synthase [Thermoanaerobaculia bacterium]|nr:(E)-4-hydroxy-3-methylbut-2-enyl-diphosphate synthase [Thermoanaerobaculia bacterium]